MLDNRTKIYDQLIQSGKFTEKNIGTKDAFVENISNLDRASKFYDKIKSHYDIGDKDTFLSSIESDLAPREQQQDTLVREDSLAPAKAPLTTFGTLTPEKAAKQITQPTNIIGTMAKDLQKTVPQARGQEVFDTLPEEEVPMPAQTKEEVNKQLDDFYAQNRGMIEKYKQIKTKLWGDVGSSLSREGKSMGLGMLMQQARVSKEDREFFEKNKEAAEQLLDRENALKIQREFVQLRNNIEKYRDTDSGLRTFWKGLTQTGLLRDFLTLGTTEIGRTLDVIGVAEKAKNNPEKLTKEERDLLFVYKQFEEASKNPTDAWFTAGQSTQQMVPFILTIMGTNFAAGGFRSGVKQAMNIATKEVLKGAAKKSINIGKKLAESAMFNLIAIPTRPTFYNELTKQGLDRLNIDFTSTAEGVMPRVTDATDRLPAIYEAAVRTFNEYFAEELSAAFGGGMLRTLGKNTKGVVGQVVRNIAKVTDNKLYKKVTDITQIGNLPVEMLEEMGTQGLNALMLGSKQDLAELANPEFYKSIAISVSAMQGAMAVTRGGLSGGSLWYERGRTNKQYRQSINNLTKIDIPELSQPIAELITATQSNDLDAMNVSLDNLRSKIDDTELFDIVMPNAASAVQSAAKKYGIDSAIEDQIIEQIGEFANKNTGDVMYGIDINNKTYYIIDSMKQGDKYIITAKDTETGIIEIKVSSDFVDIQTGTKDEFINNWLQAREIVPQEQESKEDVSVVEQAPPPAKVVPGMEFFVFSRSAVVEDVTPDGVIVIFEDGTRATVDIEDLQQAEKVDGVKPIEQSIEEVQGGQVEQQQEEVVQPQEELVGQEEIDTLEPQTAIEAEETKIIEYPRDKQGNIDYNKITDPAIYSKALFEEFEGDAINVVDELIEEQNKKLKNAKKTADVINRKRQEKIINAEILRLGQVRNYLSPIEQQEEALSETQIQNIEPTQEAREGVGESITPEEKVEQVAAVVKREKQKADENNVTLLYEPLNTYKEYEKEETEKAFGTEERKREAVEKVSNLLREPEFVYHRRGESSLLDKVRPRTVVDTFQESGYVDVLGQKIETPQDLADIFAIHRSPYIEKHHIIFVKDGIIVGSTATTLNRIDAARTAEMDDIDRLYRSFGADGMYYLHNHPSGNHTPSSQDVYVTFGHKEKFEQNGINLIGHVVIDTDKFSYIDTSKPLLTSYTNRAEIERYLLNDVNEFEYKTAVPKLFTQRESLLANNNPQQRMFEIGKALIGERGYSTVVVYSTSNLSITAYDVVPDGSSVEDIKTAIRDGINSNLGSRAFIVHDGSIEYKWGTLQGEVEDVINTKKMESDDFSKGAYERQLNKDAITLWDKKSEYDSNHYRSNDILETITIDGVEKPTTNSNGQPIAQTEEGIRNFYKWFGDSKVVDNEGRPLVVYHGTINDIKKFRPLSHFGTESAASDRLNFQEVDESNRVIMPVYLKINNPIKIEDQGINDVFDIAKTLKINNIDDIILAWLNTINDNDVRQISLLSFYDENYTKDDIKERISELYKRGSINDIQQIVYGGDVREGNVVGDLVAANELLIDKIKQKSYDGISYKNEFEDKGSVSFITFSPSQIKSAIGNTGEFSVDADDIRYLADIDDQAKSPEPTPLVTTPTKEFSDTTIQERAEYALSVAASLNTPIRVITDVNEISQAQSKRRGVKGWYDPKNNEVVIIIPNHESYQDIQATVLHEIVAHHGLRGLLGKEFNSVMLNVFDSLSNEVKADLMATYPSRIIADEEYLAKIAEKNADITFWAKVYAIFKNALRAFGLDLNLSEADMRYLVWRSKNRLTKKVSVIETAKDSKDAENMLKRMREDSEGNEIGDGTWSVEPHVFEFNDYPQVSSRVEFSSTTESSYVTYTNNDTGAKITVRFSEHMNNAVRFGDQLNGNTASSDQILAALGLKRKTFVPKTYLKIDTRKVKNADLSKYEVANKTIQELYDMGKDADISEYTGKIAKNSKWLIEGTKVEERIVQKRDAFGGTVQIGDYIYEDDVLYRPIQDNTGAPMPILSNTIELTGGQKFLQKVQDAMIAQKVIEENIREKGGKIGDYSSPYVQEVLSSSRASGELKNFNRDIYTPLMSIVTGWISKGDVDINDVGLYMMAKHAPERNRVKVISEVRKKISKPIYNEYSAVAKDAINSAYREVFEYRFVESPYYLQSTNEGLIWNSARAAALKEMETIRNSENGNVRSGLSDADAADIVEAFEADREVDVFWDYVKRSTMFAIDKSAEYGMISNELRDELASMYEYYVPLRGWLNKEDIDYHDTFGKNYLGNDIIDKVNKRAYGRTSLSENPLFHIPSMAESAVVSGNKNEIRRNLYRLVVNNIDREDLFTIQNSFEVNINPEGEPNWIETFEVPSKEMFDKGQARLRRPNRTYSWHKTRSEYQQHQVPVWINGMRIVIDMKGEIGRQAAMAINKTNILRPDGFISTLGSINRFIASGLTSKNPDFMLTNFFRDATFGLASYYIRGGDPTKIIKNLPKSFASINNYITNRDQATKTAMMYRDFIEQGGETGYVHMQGAVGFEKEIKRMIRKANDANRAYMPNVIAKNTIGALSSGLDYVATMSENSIRFAVYLSEIERLMTEAGVDTPTDAMKKKAALLAKDITVNFNRKGQYSAYVGSLYAFFNAAVQGSASVMKLAKENPKKFAGVAITLIGAQMLSSLASALFGGDDDETGANKYYEMNPYVRQNNFVMPDTQGRFVTIPMPHGFRALASIGTLSTDMVLGRITPQRAIFELAQNIAGELSPLSIESIDVTSTKPAAGLFNFFSPTSIRPIVEAYITNQNFMNMNITNEPFISTQKGILPNYLNAPKGTNPLLVEASRLSNKLFGGTDNISSAIAYNDTTGDVGKAWYGYIGDWDPAKLEHVFQGYFGGRLRFFNDTYKTVTSLATGETPALRNIPILRRLYQEPFMSPGWRNYYETREEVRLLESRAKDFQKAEDYINLGKINTSYNIDLINIFKVYEEQIYTLTKLMQDQPMNAANDYIKEERDRRVNDMYRDIERLKKLYKK